MGWLRNRIRLALGINKYGTPTRTRRGEKVRSISEAKIANYLFRNNIRYVYEQRLWTGRLELRAIHPDFYLPDHDTYIEFWGLSGLQSYERTKAYKLEIYRRRDKRLVELYPRDLYELDRKLGRFGRPGRSYGPAVHSWSPMAASDQERACRRCGMKNEMQDRFCTRCGGRL